MSTYVFDQRPLQRELCGDVVTYFIVDLGVMCIYLLITFAILNSNKTLLYVRLEDSIMGDMIILKGKGELLTSWDYDVTKCFHLINNTLLVKST